MVRLEGHLTTAHQVSQSACCHSCFRGGSGDSEAGLICWGRMGKRPCLTLHPLHKPRAPWLEPQEHPRAWWAVVRGHLWGDP